MGKLNRIITLQRVTTARDDNGAPVETWADLDSVWAEITLGVPTTQWQNNAMRDSAERTAAFRIRYRADVDEATVRVLHERHAWQVLGIRHLELNREMELVCKTQI